MLIRFFFCGKWKSGAKGDALFFLISHKIVSLKVGSHVDDRNILLHIFRGRPLQSKHAPFWRGIAHPAQPKTHSDAAPIFWVRGEREEEGSVNISSTNRSSYASVLLPQAEARNIYPKKGGKGLPDQMVLANWLYFHTVHPDTNELKRFPLKSTYIVCAF